MKYELNSKDVSIIKKALYQRMTDLTGFADECRRQNQRTAENEFLEMTNDCDRTLQKFNREDDV